MAKENTISKLKWIGVSAIISSIVSFILIPFLDYFSDKVLKFDLSTGPVKLSKIQEINWINSIKTEHRT